MSRDFSDGDSEPPMTYAMETAELNPFAGKCSHFRTIFFDIFIIFFDCFDEKYFS